jgi:hypothetical protein
MQTSPFSCYLLPLGPRYPLEDPRFLWSKNLGSLPSSLPQQRTRLSIICLYVAIRNNAYCNFDVADPNKSVGMVIKCKDLWETDRC